VSQSFVYRAWLMILMSNSIQQSNSI
jgi:hypothetical protein